MGLASWVEVVMVNNHTKFGWNPFNSIEVINDLKNFNLIVDADANADAGVSTIALIILRIVELKTRPVIASSCFPTVRLCSLT